jgi:hypothetical protein
VVCCQNISQCKMSTTCPLNRCSFTQRVLFPYKARFFLVIQISVINLYGHSVISNSVKYEQCEHSSCSSFLLAQARLSPLPSLTNLSDHLPFSPFNNPPMTINTGVLKTAVFKTFTVHCSHWPRPGCFPPPNCNLALVTLSEDGGNM